MKIERIRIDAFGRLADFDTGPNPLGRLVVVLGPNEAGKSTLFHLLTTLFHGFYPASRDKNTHVPWGADAAGGEMQLLLDDGTEALVERRLKATPSGRVRVGHHTMEVRNQAVPWVEHAPLRIFRQVYAVTLGDLATLDPATWGHVQDRIVGSMGSSDLKSVRSVADALESEASSIWRPGKRGNQALRVLQDDLRALRLRRSGARERDRLVRGLVEERENVRVSLREQRQQKAEESGRLGRAEAARPLHLRLQRIEALRSQGGLREELLGLTNDPPALLESLRTRRREHCQRACELTEALDEPAAVIERYDARAKSVVERADSLIAASRRVLEVAADRRRAGELSAELEEHRHRLSDEGRQLFENGWDESLREPIQVLSLPVLLDRVARTRTAETPGRAAQSIVPYTVLTLVGAALGVIGVVMSSTPALVLGAAAATAGAMGWWNHRQVSSAPRGAGAADTVADLLGDLPIRSEYLTPPGEPLTNGLSSISKRLESMERAERELAGASERVDSADAHVRSVAEPILSTTDHLSAPEIADALQDEVRAAERLREAVGHAERDRDRTTIERDRALHAAAEVGGDLEQVTGRLEALGDGDADAGALRAHRRIAAHHRADQLQIEAEREIGDAFPALDENMVIPDTLDDREIASARVRLDELTERIEASIAREESLSKDIAHLSESETVDSVDSAIEALEEQASELVRERDRKWVLAHLLRTADRAFREAHQPDLLRAGRHLAALTRGRYDRLIVDDTKPDQPFLLGGPQLPAPVPLAPPISTGTLEQAYLSLRLAIIDHLDQGHETLPLFVDEVFVNWDEERRSRGLDVFGSISENRQIFVFTCHPELAAQLRDRGGHVLPLPRS